MLQNEEHFVENCSRWLPIGKTLVQSFESCAELAAFFTQHRFYLKKHLRGELCILTNICGLFPKRNKKSAYSHKENSRLFKPNIQFDISSENSNFGRPVSAI